MGETPPEQVTRLLDAAKAGRHGAATELMELVYRELRDMARRQIAGVRPGDTLQATALVHEVYLRLFSSDAVPWENRAHFFFAAARAMRDILVEDARKDASIKRGGGRNRITLDEAIASVNPVDEDLIALDGALARLEAIDTRSSDVVQLRFFAGLTVEETAEAMGLSAATVKRHWQYARAWLRSQLLGAAAAQGGPGRGS